MRLFGLVLFQYHFWCIFLWPTVNIEQPIYLLDGLCVIYLCLVTHTIKTILVFFCVYFSLKNIKKAVFFPSSPKYSFRTPIILNKTILHFSNGDASKVNSYSRHINYDTMTVAWAITLSLYYT